MGDNLTGPPGFILPVAPSDINNTAREGYEEALSAIVFIDAHRGAGDLVVTICRGFSLAYLSWSEFKSLGSFATSAVVAAGWSCRKLDQITESVREGLFLEEELDQLREQARDKRNRVSVRRPSD
ncbi:hypothetical protein PENNAL_c0051G03555 [Penicillium nalgiovense]|uniref:Uncharacterized protein n=1 Tax=Penicillium nalgiovense TaxID=60175 RepID=A0A1V6XWA7_PENNA|nr:hypothetical protein PENNAL_c0051G03555 [Penicillium nalgiovense]